MALPAFWQPALSLTLKFYIVNLISGQIKCLLACFLCFVSSPFRSLSFFRIGRSTQPGHPVVNRHNAWMVTALAMRHRYRYALQGLRQGNAPMLLDQPMLLQGYDTVELTTQYEWALYNCFLDFLGFLFQVAFR